jgi:hypothetical protein
MSAAKLLSQGPVLFLFAGGDGFERLGQELVEPVADDLGHVLARRELQPSILGLVELEAGRQ